MTKEYQAGKLILSQIGMFNEAVKMLENVVQPALLAAIDERVESFADDIGWQGVFELAGDESDCYLAPPEWDISDKKAAPDLKAWFAIDYALSNYDDDNDYWVALLCGQGSEGGELGLMFGISDSVYGKKRAWNAFFNTIDPAKLAELKTMGFKVVENRDGKKTFLLPVHLNADALAETWGRDGEFSRIDQCLEPLGTALQKVENARPIFDAILKGYPTKS